MKTEIKKILYKFLQDGITSDDAAQQVLDLFDVSGSLPDVDNYDYLRGFVDGYGGEEPHDVFPDGFKDINDGWDRMYELDCKNYENNFLKTKFVVVNLPVLY